MENKETNHPSEYQLNPHVQVSFDDVFEEAQDIESLKCVQRGTKFVFTCSMNVTYQIFSVLFAFPSAIFWGIGYGCITFNAIFCITPCLRFCYVPCFSIRRFLSIILSTFIVPLVETFSLLYSRIHITSSYSDPPKPFGSMPSGLKRDSRKLLLNV